MKRAGWIVSIFTGMMCCFSLGATLALLQLPDPNANALALAPWAEEQGFLVDATVYVLPVVPPKKSDVVRETALYPELSDQVREASSWFNDGAQGKRTIFLHVNGAPPEVMRPTPSIKEEESGLHDCQPLIDKAVATAQALGPSRVVLVIAEKTWKCPFTGLAGFRGNWVIVTGWDVKSNTFNKKTLIHELGHTVGLPHARRFDCAASYGVFESPRNLSTCDIIEYGDVTDPMGAGVDSAQPGFNAFNRYLLGWNDAPLVIDTPGTKRVRIPLATTSGPGYVEIPGGFMISYRAPSGKPDDIDASLGWDADWGNLAGVYLHRKASSLSDAVTYPILLPFRPNRPAGQEGDHFISPESNVAFTIKKIVPGEYAEISLHIGTRASPVRDRWGPTIALAGMGAAFDYFFQAQWVTHDPSGIKESYVLLDGRRHTPDRSGGMFVPFRDRPQRISFVSVDNEGNISVSKKFTIPAR